MSSFIDWLCNLLNYTYRRLFVPESKSVDGDVNGDSLLVLPGGPDGHLEICKSVLAHPISPGFRHLQDADELRLERNALTEKAGWRILV